jgi:hypothetical protein
MIDRTKERESERKKKSGMWIARRYKKSKRKEEGCGGGKAG